MIQTVRNAWKIPELKRKMLFVIFALLIFRLGSAIPVPFINGTMLQSQLAAASGTIFGLINVMSGDAFARATVFALSIQPYINSSIIIQLLTVAIPALERMAKEGGEEGRKKIAAITRYATVAIALIQAFGYYTLIKSYGMITVPAGSGVWGAIVIIASFTAGSAFLMWLGEQITEFGVGNGISIILFAGIVSRGPALVQVLWYGGKAALGKTVPAGYGAIPVWAIPLIIIGMLAIVMLIVFVSDAERRIPVQYAKRVVGRKAYGGQSTYIPLKVIAVGVLPLIFAYSFMSFPGTIFAFFGPNSGVYKWWDTYMSQSSALYLIVCAVLIILFSYFYTSITFNPREIAENIQKQGGTINGRRPGKVTVDYLQRTSNRLTLFAALFLAVLATVPTLLSVWNNVQIPFAASSILIAVSVAIETVRQVEAQLVMRHYKGFL